MSLSKYSQIQEGINVEQELFSLQKLLFECKMKRSTRQDFKPHVFHHTKRRIAQLKYRMHTSKIINSSFVSSFNSTTK